MERRKYTFFLSAAEIAERRSSELRRAKSAVSRSVGKARSEEGKKKFPSQAEQKSRGSFVRIPRAPKGDRKFFKMVIKVYISGMSGSKEVSVGLWDMGSETGKGGEGTISQAKQVSYTVILVIGPFTQ